MARRFLSNIDLLGFAIQNAMMHPVSSDPSGLTTGDAGRLWYNTTTGKLKVWNGTAAVDFLDRANHTGTQLAATISDFDSQVRTSRLDQMAAPTASVAMAAQKITGLADGTANSDAATYGQLLALINNQSFKAAVRVATTANIATLAGGAPNTLDGVTLAVNDRVLVKDQTTASANGIYTVTTVGSGANGSWARATDFDTSAEAVSGSIVSVQEGTANADKLFMLATNAPITLGSTALTFSAYGASTGEIGVAGAGLTKTGTTYDVIGGTGIVVGADLVSVDYSITGRKVTGAVPATTSGIFAVSGANVTVNHGLGNSAVDVRVTIGSTPPSGTTAGQPVEVDWLVSDSNNIVITFPAAPAANNYIVSVVG